MPVLIHNARILTPFAQQDGAVLVQNGRIVDVSRQIDISRSTKTIDAKNLYLVPGYVDMHVHGGGGRDVMEGTAEAALAMANAHAREGTTTVLPTTRTAPLEDVERAMDAVREAQGMACDGTIAGVHLQGPFLAPENMPQKVRQHLCTPLETDWQALLDRWPGGIRAMGISPELPGAYDLAEKLRSMGVVASISHSGASYDQVLAAVTHGFSDVSNLYKESPAMETHDGFLVPGVTECALVMDELSVQVVADGSRVPLMLLQLIFRCKGAENIILVSDAGREFSGEAANMAALVRTMAAAGTSLRVALRMATVNPARRVGLEQSKGRISSGYDADILLLDEALNVRFCMAKGKILRDELEEI